MKEEDIRKRETLNTYLALVEKDCQVYFKDVNRYPKVSCPACGSSEYSFEFKKNNFEYVTCQRCKTLFVANRPEVDQLKKFYAQSESSSYWVNSFFKPVLEVRREKLFQPRVESILKDFGGNQSWTVGDVGAGFGIFLEELKKKWPGGRFVAIEPSLEQAAICRKLKLEVECSLVEKLEGYDNAFDLLTAFELFEHLHTPEIFAKKIYELLKPGGYFFMTTLSGQGFDIQLLWEKSKAVTPPHHLNFFNPHSIVLLLKRCGLNVKEVSTPGRLDWDIVEGMITKENVDVGRFWKFLAEQGTSETKAELQQWIVKHRLSSHMKVIAQKPLKKI